MIEKEIQAINKQGYYVSIYEGGRGFIASALAPGWPSGALYPVYNGFGNSLKASIDDLARTIDADDLIGMKKKRR